MTTAQEKRLEREAKSDGLKMPWAPRLYRVTVLYPEERKLSHRMWGSVELILLRR
jgi:hypothetical protein